ncbi:MAG: hypothetical protein AB1635_10000 [Acidobacteriota bacterium]
MRAVAVASLVVAVLSQPVTARAEWFAAPFLGVKFAGSSNFVDLDRAAGERKLTVGGMAGFLSPGVLGIEVDASYTPGFFERSGGTNLLTGSSVSTLMGGVIAAVPTSVVGDSLRPYVTGAIGLIHVGLEDIVDIFTVRTNLLGIGVGGGAIGPIGRRTALRFELRYIKSLGSADDAVLFGETQVSFWRAGVAVVFRP